MKSGWSKKRRNLAEMVKAFHEMPKAMANVALLELTTVELDGNPINWVSGNLNGSFGIEHRRDMAIVKQVSAQAPYAPRVMGPVSIARRGKPALELLMDRLTPRIEAAIVKEFKTIESTINAGGNYKFNVGQFEAMI